MTELHVAIGAVVFSIVSLPVTYYLGCRSAWHASYNAEIDNLEELNQKIIKSAIQVLEKNKYEQSDYYLLVSYNTLLRKKCLKLAKKNELTASLKDDLLDIRDILTDRIFDENIEKKTSCVGSIIILLNDITNYFPKKFI